MANIISAKDLNDLLHGKSKFALIDVREAGEYNSSHIADSSLIPRKELEFRMDVSAPVKGELLVICDDDGRTFSSGISWGWNPGRTRTTAGSPSPAASRHTLNLVFSPQFSCPSCHSYS